MRRLIAFDSSGETLIGTLDLPEQLPTIGVLIVSGGNEVRQGAHRGMAMLAAELSSAGLAVLRFDRAGIGDSTGENGGWAAGAPDIIAAGRLLTTEAGVARVLGVGNCDAAAALATFGRRLGIDAVVLTNPWLGSEADSLPPAAAIRARYRERLVDPDAWRRLLRGKVSLRKLVAGIGKLARKPPRPELAARILDGIAAWGDDATIVLASGDATAIAFADAAATRPFRTHRLDTASHSFAGADSRVHLLGIVTSEAYRLRAARIA
ncbi:hydrolase 1, exosortase A system-associated [Sphingomonas sp.]|uniref:hydrolase 1, exosortase A system-associated n=1 Tax=Sphingomonas sp. TaxID=28214 RepID=UPI002D80A539|nr:hydrolase 1, exosortase A system-associated [Sphingomonas sp.]HEU0043599.1 hydrolase 1, exosortase A system-associated [Sphingomonas sp.]